MSMKRMERSLECGGLNLTSVPLRIASQRIWLLLQAQQSDSWWCASWRHQLNSVALPHQDWTSQHLSELSRLLLEGSLIRSSCSALAAHDVLDQLELDASSGTIYRLISPRDRMLLTVTQQERTTDPEFAIDYKRTFRRLWRTPARHRLQSTCYRMLSHSLPRAPHGKQDCPHCGLPETTLHIFQDCADALLVLIHATGIWERWTGMSINLVGPDFFNLGPRKGVRTVELAFRLSVIHLIWIRRCQALHNDSVFELDWSPCKAYFKAELERSIKIAESRTISKFSDLIKFHHQWLIQDLFIVTQKCISFRPDL
eukprot:TRINITY_DN209_c0_g2_i2.p1 TRINITY_DN209_c0_g2~~TRINITY_DN209_c0_g2_i2.p1  ORF type:complete len:360 (-),score=18.97 TRINITY_DN209_c0_g2_i2:590-1528(-)